MRSSSSWLEAISAWYSSLLRGWRRATWPWPISEPMGVRISWARSAENCCEQRRGRPSISRAFEHGVERLYHLLQLGRRSGDVEAGIQAGRMDLRRLRQRAQQAQAVAQDQPAEQGGAEERRRHSEAMTSRGTGRASASPSSRCRSGDLQRFAAADQDLGGEHAHQDAVVGQRGVHDGRIQRLANGDP